MGQGDNLRAAWDKAYATDKQAPFGGIIAVNRPLDGPCAEAIAEIFSEVIIAPDFSPDALEILQKKKNLRLMKIIRQADETFRWDTRSVGGCNSFLQQQDKKTTTMETLKVVTKRVPTAAEMQAMLFGWRIVKHVKSNAILYAAADWHAGHRRGADEPRGCQPDSGMEGGRSGSFIERQRGLQ